MSGAAAPVQRRRRLLSLQDRVLLGACLRHVTIVLVMLTTIAVAIDTASWMARVAAAAAETGLSPIFAVVRFVGLRALDNGIQTLPIAAILGFIWTEASYHQSGHRLVDRITGRTEGRAMRSIFVAAVVIAGCQTVLDNVVRPYAVETMIRERLAFWPRYVEFMPGRPVWIATGEAIIQGTADGIGTSELRDVTYHGFYGNRLTLIVQAKSLRPAGATGPAGMPQWRFGAAAVFDLSTGGRQDGHSGTRPSAQAVEDMVIPLTLDPGWLPLAAIKPAYLTLPELTQMARMEHVPDGTPNYGAWLIGRLTAGAVLGLLCAFIALFFRHRVDRGGFEATVLLSLGLGYGGVLATRLLRVNAEYGTLAPVTVAAVVPLILSVMIGITMWRSTRYDAVARTEHRQSQIGNHP